jgi:hypothetical protein
MLNEKKELYIAPFKDTRWLCLSSLFFTIPSYYAYINNLYFHSITLLTASLISANYWRKATYSWRRTIDLMFAKIAFIIFFSDGIYYITSENYLITGSVALITSSYCFYLSSKLHKLHNNNWYKYHLLFHLISTYQQFIVIDSIKNKNNVVKRSGSTEYF